MKTEDKPRETRSFTGRFVLPAAMTAMTLAYLACGALLLRTADESLRLLSMNLLLGSYVPYLMGLAVLTWLSIWLWRGRPAFRWGEESPAQGESVEARRAWIRARIEATRTGGKFSPESLERGIDFVIHMEDHPVETEAQYMRRRGFDPGLRRLLLELHWQWELPRKWARKRLLAQGPRILPMLRSYSREEGYPYRTEILGLIAALHPQGLIPGLVEGLAFPADPHEAWQVCNCLRDLGAEAADAVPALEVALEQHKPCSFERHAKGALGSIRIAVARREKSRGGPSDSAPEPPPP